jgi:hypothetical protein
MKHVSFCGLRLRALVVITAFAAAALAFASPALAVNEPAVPLAGTFTKGPPQTADEWTGTILGAMAPADCGRVTEVGVEGNICSVHDTDPVDSGTAEVVVMIGAGLMTTPQVAVGVFRCNDPRETPPLPQVDNATCTQQVAFADQSANPDIPQLRVTFPVIGDLQEPADAAIFYEVRVIPLETGGEFVDYTACASYIDTGTDLCENDPRLDQMPQPPVDQPIAADAFLVCNPGAAGNRRLTGSGQITDSNNNKTEQVSVSVRQRSEKPKNPQGQINHRFFPTKRKFHSKKLACASFNDETKQVEVRGIGWVKVDGQKPQKVCFVADFQDDPSDTQQKGTGDNFHITTVPFFRNDTSTTTDDTCGRAGVAPETHGGPITKGNFRYRINDRGDDCEYDEYDRDRTYSKDSDYDWSHEGR